MDHPYEITISVQRIERRIELLKIHSNLSYDVYPPHHITVCPISNQRILPWETFSKNFPELSFEYINETWGAFPARGKKKKERNTRADIYRNPSLLTFEWSSNRVLGQRTRVSSTPRNSFIEKGVSSPWLACRTRKEEERMRGRERKEGCKLDIGNSCSSTSQRSQQGKPEVMALRSPSGIETAAA